MDLNIVDSLPFFRSFVVALAEWTPWMIMSLLLEAATLELVWATIWPVSYD